MIESAKITIITPAFNEESNLIPLYERIRASMRCLEVDWDWLIVDDNSSDNTQVVIRELAKLDDRVRGIRLSRNFGSHHAIMCGFENTNADYYVVMAADLQDPPEEIATLLQITREKQADLVWAVRKTREGVSKFQVFLSNAYYYLMRNLVGLKDLPPTGADFFIINHNMKSAVTKYKDKNNSLLALLSWIGFNQEWVYYDKASRQSGKTGWTFRKKVKLMLDTLISFSHSPLRFATYLGTAIAACGFLYALIILLNFITQSPVPGWSSLMVALLVVGGTIMIMLGIIGEYLWRAVDEAKQRPNYLIESYVGFEDGERNID